VGAGIVTFALNFWKGERDIRRANLERFYTAVHKYTNEVSMILLEVRTNGFDPAKDWGEFTAQSDLISVLVDLYFPQLKADFASYKSKVEDFIVSPAGILRKGDPRNLEEDFLRIIEDDFPAILNLH
jgi:hypothetical protein